MQLFHYGQGSFHLENKAIVFIGEISYSWYLVHWPFVTYCKFMPITEVYCKFYCKHENKYCRFTSCLFIDTIHRHNSSLCFREKISPLGEEEDLFCNWISFDSQCGGL